MALDLSKYGVTSQSQPSTGSLDLSKYGATPTAPSAPTPTEPNLFQRILGDIQKRGAQNVDIYNQYTAKGDTSLSNNIAGGTKLVANTFAGIGDVFGQLVNSNPITKTAADVVSAPVRAGFNATTDALSNTKLFQEASKNPQATKTLEDFLSAGGSLGEIAGNILAAEGARTLAVKGQQVTEGLYKKLTAQTETSIKNNIISRFEKAVKPSVAGQKTSAQTAKYKDQVVTGVKTIHDNRSNLSFTDDVGDAITAQSPKTLQQLSDAIEQTKKSVFSNYDALAKQAGKEGVAINTEPIGKVLDDVINNQALQFSHPEAITYAQNIKARLAQNLLPDGSPVGYKQFTADTAQDIIQNYNKSLEAFYRNPTYDNASKAAIDAAVANNMREALDNGITSLTGTQYQTLKSSYGALKAIEKDVVKASLREARKNVKGLIDFTDILSGGQVVSGILSLNPAQIASGVTQKAITEYIKYLNNPNRAIEQMFKFAEKL